jgi:hypothetical protein
MGNVTQYYRALNRAVGAGPLPYTPPLDLYPGAEVAYSMRLLDSLYTGPLLSIRNSISLIDTDIYPDATGYFDKAAVMAATPSGVALLTRIYDQSGNGHDLITNSGPLTPLYDSIGGFYIKNGKEALYIINSYLTTGLRAGLVGKFKNAGPKAFFTLMHTGPANGVTHGLYFAAFGTTSGWVQRANATQFLYANIGGANLTANPALVANTDYLLGFNQSGGSVLSQYKNGGLFNSATLATPTANGNELRLGAAGGLGSVTSFFKECIGYSSDQAANLAGINSNINSYFSSY